MKITHEKKILQKICLTEKGTLQIFLTHYQKNLFCDRNYWVHSEM